MGTAGIIAGNAWFCRDPRGYTLLPLSAPDLIAIQHRLGPAKPDTTAV